MKASTVPLLFVAIVLPIALVKMYVASRVINTDHEAKVGLTLVTFNGRRR